MKVRANIDDQEAIRSVLGEETYQPSFVGKHRPVEPTWPVCEDRIFASQRKEIPVQRID
jgi:hypothetical protein